VAHFEFLDLLTCKHTDREVRFGTLNTLAVTYRASEKHKEAAATLLLPSIIAAMNPMKAK